MMGTLNEAPSLLELFYIQPAYILGDLIEGC